MAGLIGHVPAVSFGYCSANQSVESSNGAGPAPITECRSQVRDRGYGRHGLNGLTRP